MLQMQPHTAEIAEIRKLETIEGEESAFLRVIDKHIASSSMVEEIRWINLTRQQIAHLLYLGYVYINTCHDTSETD